MTETLIEFFNEHINNPALVVILIAIFPIIELRGAIPIGVAMGLNPMLAMLYAWIGSTIMSPILLLLLKPILELMKKWKPFRSLAVAVEDVFKGKAEKMAKNEMAAQIERRKKMIGIYTFVAVPVPMTGVWTGSAIAVFINLDFWRSFAMVALGNLTAGLIVTLLSVLLGESLDLVLNLFFFIAAVVLLIFVVKLTIKMQKNKKKNDQDKDNLDKQI